MFTQSGEFTNKSEFISANAFAGAQKFRLTRTFPRVYESSFQLSQRFERWLRSTCESDL